MTPAYRNSFALLLVAALLLRLAAGWWWQSRLDGLFGLGDSGSYWTLAQTIAEGKPYEFGSDHARMFRLPVTRCCWRRSYGWPATGAAACCCARAEAAVLGVLAVFALWWLTRLLFDDHAALLAAAMASFYPGAIVAGMLVLSEAPFCPLLLLQFALWTMAWRGPTATNDDLWILRRLGGGGGHVNASQLAAVHAAGRGRGDAGRTKQNSSLPQAGQGPG